MLNGWLLRQLDNFSGVGKAFFLLDNTLPVASLFCLLDNVPLLIILEAPGIGPSPAGLWARSHCSSQSLILAVCWALGLALRNTACCSGLMEVLRWFWNRTAWVHISAWLPSCVTLNELLRFFKVERAGVLCRLMDRMENRHAGGPGKSGWHARKQAVSAGSCHYYCSCHCPTKDTSYSCPRSFILDLFGWKAELTF